MGRISRHDQSDPGLIILGSAGGVPRIGLRLRTLAKDVWPVDRFGLPLMGGRHLSVCPGPIGKRCLADIKHHTSGTAWAHGGVPGCRRGSNRLSGLVTPAHHRDPSRCRTGEEGTTDNNLPIPELSLVATQQRDKRPLMRTRWVGKGNSLSWGHTE
jgi:hypothetical protein